MPETEDEKKAREKKEREEREEREAEEREERERERDERRKRRRTPAPREEETDFGEDIDEVRRAVDDLGKRIEKGTGVPRWVVWVPLALLFAAVLAKVGGALAERVRSRRGQ